MFKLDRILKHGCEGDDVKALQSILRSTGDFSGAVRGNFLDLTAAAVSQFQMSHQDPKSGKPLAVDGEVWPGYGTERALQDPAGSAQRSGLGEKWNKLAPVKQIPAGLSDRRVAILTECSRLYAQGIREIPDGSNQGDGVDQFVYGGWVGSPWCMLAVAEIWKNVEGKYFLGQRHAHCYTVMQRAKKAGVWRDKNNYEPIPGDIGIMVTNWSKKFGHTFYVSHVNSSGSKINTFEGNFGNRFKRGTRNKSQSSLLGYINLFGEENHKFRRGLIQTMKPTGGTR